VFFVGAGISAGAGLPAWTCLLRALALEAGIADEEWTRMSRLPEVDQAAVIASTLRDGDQTIGEYIAAHYGERETYGLGHALLAGLPVDEFVTTNYDALLEEACAAAGRPVAALPYELPSEERPRWLLKMHGSISHPDEIVLTRDDYLRFQSQRGALAGIVQALLVTRRMAFVGFSLTDDNFYRIAYDVREAIRRPPTGGPAGPFGVAITPYRAATQAVWKRDLDCVVIDDAAEEYQPEQGRVIEIALDELGRLATTGRAHLLDASYAQVLDADDRHVAARLRDLACELAAVSDDGVAWPEFRRLVADLGWRPHGDREPPHRRGGRRRAH
jgi:hypothetical protein